MSINSKILLIIALVVIAVIITGVVVFLRTVLPTALSQKATEKDFLKNYERILIVTNYLVNAEYEDMYISKTGDNKTVFANGYGHIAISDSQVIEAMSALFENGYSVIAKNNNTSYFQRSSTLDFGSGVAYSTDSSEPYLQFLTKLEPLSKPNWYYYEEDFNVWRERNNN
jgi:uncharacterized membrane protein